MWLILGVVAAVVLIIIIVSVTTGKKDGTLRVKSGYLAILIIILDTPVTPDGEG